MQAEDRGVDQKDDLQRQARNVVDGTAAAITCLGLEFSTDPSKRRSRHEREGIGSPWVGAPRTHLCQ